MRFCKRLQLKASEKATLGILVVDLAEIRSNSVRNGSERLWIHSLVTGAGICGVGIILNPK